MDIVVDTNVLAYFLLGVRPHCDEVDSAVRQADAILAPDLLRVELANVLWKWSRSCGVAPQDVVALLDDAETLVSQFVGSGELGAEALLLALERNHAVYDTLFVALARSRQTVLVTYDRRLRRVFPEDVLTVPEHLSQVG